MTTNTSGVNGNSALTEILNSIDLGPTDSIQFSFAKLQMAQAQICKNKANDYMKQIEDVQAEQKEVAAMISRARQLQTDAGTGTSTMPADMKKFFTDHGLAWDKTDNDDKHNKDEWTFNIQSLTNYQESVSNQTQTLMVYLQDFISQYNSYTQGATSMIDKGAQVLTSVATGR